MSLIGRGCGIIYVRYFSGGSIKYGKHRIYQRLKNELIVNKMDYINILFSLSKQKCCLGLMVMMEPSHFEIGFERGSIPRGSNLFSPFQENYLRSAYLLVNDPLAYFVYSAHVCIQLTIY